MSINVYNNFERERVIIMGRPRKQKLICALPEFTAFNTKKGVKDAVHIRLDEYEVIRLIDNLGLTQQECARQMQMARTSITSIYEAARYKLSMAIVDNKALIIDGGDYHICGNSGNCCGKCGQNRCKLCKHGSCDYCIGIYHENGCDCYTR